MVPGLWLEPEVVGVNSPVVTQLPPEAFFQRDGRLVTEHGRHHLDLRHPAAVKHLDEVVDFVVGDLGVGYLKLDYNIEIAPGPNTGGLSPGAGLLEANRAQLDWLDAVLDRHPALVLENCSSGGMRIDYALLSRLQLQSTSDQQDPLRYPPIAAAAPAAIAPEQAASWAYPQPSFTDDEIAFTLCGAMLGRIYLSGHLDHMSREQRALVAEAVRVHKDLRGSLASALPFWPLGLPRWTDPWIALGLRAPEASYLTVWHRGPFEGDREPDRGRDLEAPELEPGRSPISPCPFRTYAAGASPRTCSIRVRPGPGPRPPGTPPRAPCRCSSRASRPPASSGSARSERAPLRRRRHRRPGRAVHPRPGRPLRGRRDDRGLVRHEPGADELLRRDPDRGRAPVARAVRPG